MIGQPLLWLPVSTTPAGISPVCFRKPGRFLTRVLLQRCWRRPWASPPWPYWASWSKVNGILGEKAKLGLTWATPAPLIFIDNQLYAKGNFSLAVRFTEHLKAAKTRVTGHWIESSKMLAGRSNWDCVRACARSLFLSAGDRRSEDVPSASTLHFWTSRVWEGLQSSVSHFFFRLFTRVCVYWTTFFFFFNSTVFIFKRGCSGFVCAEPTVPNTSPSSSPPCGCLESSSVKVIWHQNDGRLRGEGLWPLTSAGVVGLASACGLLYLCGRLSYFRGYSQSPQQR